MPRAANVDSRAASQAKRHVRMRDVPTAAGVDASADNESCTWVYKDQQGRITREVEFALGLNMPFMFASRVGECTAAGQRRQAVGWWHRAVGVAHACVPVRRCTLPRWLGCGDVGRKCCRAVLPVAMPLLHTFPGRPLPWLTLSHYRQASPAAHDLSQVGGTEICQVQRKYEALNPVTDGYTTAYFVVVSQGSGRLLLLGIHRP